MRGLILRLLTDDEGLAPWIPFRVEKKSSAADAGGEISVKVFKIKTNASEGQTFERESTEEDVFSTFGNAIAHILDSGIVAGVLFIIDEVDRIRQRSELASVIRSRGADPRVKFALIGVGTTPQELILNHESITRQISDGCVEMPPMSNAELQEIFDNAHQVLREDGITFSDEARDWIIGVARGHPYYVHLLGKHSLIRAALSGESVISREIAEDVLAEIANKGTATVQEAAYKKAIGLSYVREFIMKALAEVPEEEINTTAVYARIAAARSMDISSISVYVGQLTSGKFGAVLERTRERHYRFKDSLFKAYAAARPFTFKADKIEPEGEE